MTHCVICRYRGSLNSSFLQTELHIRTDSRIASLDGKFDIEAAKVAANRKNIEDGMVELNMNLHKLLEQFHHEPHSGFDSTPIPQEQETFSKVSKDSGRSSFCDANPITVRNITRVAVFSF